MAAGVATRRHYVEPSLSGLSTILADYEINRPFHKGSILLRACSGLSQSRRVAPLLCGLPSLTLPLWKSLRLPFDPCLSDNWKVS